MTRKDELLDTLRRSFDGDAWHGPALEEVLADVTAEEAIWRAGPETHSIWEITLHIGGWSAECARRLSTGKAGEPDEGDWPDAPARASTEDWQDAIQRLFNGRDQLVMAVHQIDDDDLASTHGTTSGLNNPVTRAGLIEGAAQHNAYHGGQIALLKKMLRNARTGERASGRTGET